MTRQIPWLDYVGTLLRWQRSIIIVVVSGILTATYMAWSQVPVYEASAKLRITSERARIRVAPDGSASPTFEQVNEATLNSEAALLRSVALVREVLEPLRSKTKQTHEKTLLDRIRATLTYPIRRIGDLYRETHGAPQVSGFDGLVTGYTARLKINAIPKSNLIQVYFNDPNPQWAAEFVNQLVSGHVARHTRLNQEADALKFFEAQRQRLSQQQLEAEQALATFSEREGIDSVTDQQALWKSRLAAAQTELSAAEMQLVEVTARSGYLQRQLAGSRSDSSAQAVAAQGDVAAVQGGAGGGALIRNRIVELELQRSQLLSQYTLTSIKVRDIDRQIAEAHRLLAAEGDSPSALAVTGSGGDSLEMDLARAQAETAAVKARIEALQGRVAEARARTERLDTLAAEYASLHLQATDAHAEYLSYVKSANEAKLSNALDDLGIVNITVVDRAEVPTTPLSSTQWRTILLGAVLSLFAGVCLAFVRDYLDPSVKSAAQAERITGLPVLVEIAS